MGCEKSERFSIGVKSEDTYHYLMTIQPSLNQNKESYRMVVKTLLRAIDDLFEG